MKKSETRLGIKPLENNYNIKRKINSNKKKSQKGKKVYLLHTFMV